MAEFEIKGGDKLLRDLRQFTPKLQKKGLRNAARRAMVIVRDAARANAQAIDDPLTAEKISKNITVQESLKQSKRVGGVVIRVGVLGGARQYGNTKENVRKQRVGKSYKTAGSSANPGGDTWYWRLIEFGTERTRARPFLRPAIENNVGAVTDKFTSELSTELDKLAAQMRTGG